MHVNPASRIPVLLVAAIAAAVGTLGPAGPANADQGGPYVAIAYSPDNGSYGWANNAFTQDQAQDTALQNCRNFGGQQCEIDAWAHNECAALAVAGGAHYGWYGATIAEAQDAALTRNGGGEVIVAHCASGNAGWG